MWQAMCIAHEARVASLALWLLIASTSSVSSWYPENGRSLSQGVLIIDLKPQISPGETELCIGHLKVDWEHQGQGVGCMLILSRSGNFAFLRFYHAAEKCRIMWERKEDENWAYIGAYRVDVTNPA